MSGWIGYELWEMNKALRISMSIVDVEMIRKVRNLEWTKMKFIADQKGGETGNLYVDI